MLHHLFFEELSLTRKENILRNSKQTRKEKYRKHLEKLTLNIGETLHSDFLPDRFSALTDQRKLQVKTQRYCRVMLQIWK